MDFDVYCDESRPDLLSSQNPKSQFTLIGSLWLTTKDRTRFKAEIHSLRNKFKVGGEFKWQKVSPSRLAFYNRLVGWFVEKADRVRFRCIVIDRNEVNIDLFHGGDSELGFYKFYYQMLHHWIADCNSYSIFLDYKQTRMNGRLRTLGSCLSSSNLLSQIKTVQAINSSESVFIQLADVLTGIAAYRINCQIRPDSAKSDLLMHFESLLGREICSTFRSEQKFNVFHINLSGGW